MKNSLLITTILSLALQMAVSAQTTVQQDMETKQTSMAGNALRMLNLAPFLTAGHAGRNDLPMVFDPEGPMINNLAMGLSGTYTIGGASPDFVDFNDAVDSLNMVGVAGAVVFDVRDGVYNEQVVLTEITGTSATNTVTFQSESGDSSLVTLTYSANNTNNYTLQLDGADWLIFKNLTLEATHPSYGHVLDLRNSANNNRFENCELQGYNTTGTSADLAVVYSPFSNVEDEFNVFQNNLLLNGSSGFYWVGNSQTGLEAGNEFDNNRIENSQATAMYLYYQDAIQVRDNVLTNATGGSDGIYARFCDNNSVFLRNRISGFQTGIRLEFSDGTPTDKVLLHNNFVQTTGTNWGQGIYCYEGSHHQIFHNSVQVHNTNTAASAFYTYLGNNKEVLNNIFANYGGGYAIYRSSTNGMTTCNYNDLFTTGLYLGYWDSDQTTLSDWQNASPFDVNSLSLDPKFVATDDYPVVEYALNGAGSSLAGVTDDIEGEARNAAGPDIGADEFEQPTLDAGVEAFVTQSIPFAPGAQNVTVRVKNFGTDVLTGFDIDWSHNGSGQTTVNWSGTLASEATVDILLGSLTLPTLQAHEIRAWTTNPNSMSDLQNANDTTTLSNLHAALSGIFTLGGSSPDFADFAEATAHLEAGGIVGDMFLDVRDGTYNEQVVLHEVPGAAANSSVTFRSESGDSSLVTLTFSANSTDNYTLLLDGADWIRVEKMTLAATHPSYGHVLDLRNSANKNRFENCRLQGYNTTSTSADLAVVYSPFSNVEDEFNVFQNNLLLNGSSGFYWVGNSETGLEAGNEFDNNRIENSQATAMYLYYQDAIQVRDNVLTNPTGNSDGIYARYCDNNSAFLRNRISGFQTGIRLEFSDGTPADKVLLHNNFVQTTGTNWGQGIYCYEGSHHQIFHNSVQVHNTNTAASAFYTYLGSNKEVLNNIFTNFGGGYAIYRSSTNGIATCDYNDLYTTGQFLGYWDSNQESLTDWQNASVFDGHSLFDQSPVFGKR